MPRRPDPKKCPKGCVTTRRELAELMGVQPRQVSNYVEQGMPRTAAGYFSVSECFAWRADQTQRDARLRKRKPGADARGGDGDPAQAIDELKRQLAEVELEMRKLKLAQQRGDLLEREVVDELLAQRADWLVADLVDGAEHMAPRFEGRTGRDLVKAIREVMTHIVNTWRQSEVPWE